MKLAALGLSYAAASGWVGAVKSTLCRWLQREPLDQPELRGRVLEMDTAPKARPNQSNHLICNATARNPI